VRRAVKGSAKRGFTLVETLVAVAILGLVAAGSLRLSAISAKTLGEVRAGRENLALLRSFRLRAYGGGLENRGREKGLSWETAPFYFPGQRGLPEGYSCRKITIRLGPERGGGELSLYIPDRETWGELEK
jgi:prepilin-type N-terminal cleavage/methylation domain-containing protein